MTDWNRYPNFSETELACRHCGKAPMDPAFMTILQAIRDRVGFPLMISSGYRCPEHNAKVSGTGRDGPHTTGKAADIRVAGGDALKVVHEALRLGVPRIGVSQKGQYPTRFIHLDISTAHGGPTIWSY